MGKILEKKENLNKEDMVSLKFDKAFHIMYANEKHLETLTVLLSRVLKIEYRKLEGKEGKFEPYEEDLMLLCAAMMVDNQNDFHNIVSEV